MCVFKQVIHHVLYTQTKGVNSEYKISIIHINPTPFF